MEDGSFFTATILLPEDGGALDLQLPFTDTVRALSTGLASHPASVSVTHYRLELELPGVGGGQRALLSDAVDLSRIAHALSSRSANAETRAVIRVHHEPLTTRAARRHVRRLREVLLAPPAAPVRVSGSARPQALAGTPEAPSPVASDSDAAAAPLPAAENEDDSSDDGGFTTGCDIAHLIASDETLSGRALLAVLADQRARAAAAAEHFAGLVLPVPIDPSLIFPVPPADADDLTPQLSSTSSGQQQRAGVQSSRPLLLLPARPFTLTPPLTERDIARAEPLVRCLKEISFSSWNPPPAAVRAHGIRTTHTRGGQRLFGLTHAHPLSARHAF